MRHVEKTQKETFETTQWHPRQKINRLSPSLKMKGFSLF